jgi:hypothetical protein
VFTIGVDGAGWRQRTADDAGENTLPAWSHDGALYYYKGRSLHRFPAAGGPSVEVLPDFHWSSRNYVTLHVDKIAFHEYYGAEDRTTVIKDLASGTETRLPRPAMNPMQWTKDGTELLGFRADGTILICAAAAAAATASCETLTDGEAPVRGARPRWSRDEQRIFFRRPAERAFHTALWVVGRDGRGATRLFDLGPLAVDDFYYGVAADDAIVWNQFEAGDSRIFMEALD